MKEQESNKAPLFSFKYFFYDFIKLGVFLTGWLWFRPKFIYLSEAAKKKLRGGALVLSNHTSYLDPLYLIYGLWYRRQRFVCMKEFYDSKLRGLIFRLVRCIPIDRQNTSFDSLRLITDALKGGEVVSIFPEGHIDWSGDIDAFKSGPVLMSVLSGAPILPVYIEKPRRAFFSRLRIVVGEPLDVVGCYGRRPAPQKLSEIAALLREKELELKKLSEEELRR